MKILIADDEAPLVAFLHRGLIAEGNECITETQLHNVLTRLKQEQPDLLILDRMFDDQDSATLLPEIIALPTPPMVLLLTAIDDVKERINGLQLGADDYLCKPFDFDELLARVMALGRRRPGQSNETIDTSLHSITVGSLQLDTQCRLITLAGEELPCTKIEYELLLYFAQNTGKVLTRERILSRVWQSNSDPMTNIVDVYISRLRNKLSTASDVTIQTLRGNGYRLVNDRQ